MQIEVCVPKNTADNFIAKFRPIYFSPGYTQFPGMLFQVTIVAVNLSVETRRPRLDDEVTLLFFFLSLLC